jgi:hypothetical protein
MSLPPSFRALIPLVIGLAVGVIGATLFLQSLPGGEGSAAERANQLEVELKRAKNRIAALEAMPDRAPHSLFEKIARGGDSSQDGRRSLADGARRIAEDIREGRPVSPEDIFKASQPLIRDLSPLFDRMRVKEQQKAIDRMTGELARKYNLTKPQQDLLKQWFQKKSEDDAKQWSAMIGQDGTRLEDLMRASMNVRPDEGLDTFMPSILSGDKLTAFRTERMDQRAQRVEQEADLKVQRLDAMVGLDDAQQEKVFGIIARSSREYDPAMKLEGMQGEIGPTPGGNRYDAMLAVLRPDQRAAYEAERQRRREEAGKDLEAVGLMLPPEWEMFDEDNFR